MWENVFKYRNYIGKTIPYHILYTRVMLPILSDKIIIKIIASWKHLVTNNIYFKHEYQECKSLISYINCSNLLNSSFKYIRMMYLKSNIGENVLKFHFISLIPKTDKT